MTSYGVTEPENVDKRMIDFTKSCAVPLLNDPNELTQCGRMTSYGYIYIYILINIGLMPDVTTTLP